jgi:hypothetical protein
MEQGYDYVKTQIGFGIATDHDIDPQSITDALQLTPSRTKKRGDIRISKHDGREFIEARTVWAIDSEWTVHEAETVSHHVEYFKKILTPKLEIIRKYKEDDRFDVSFWIWIETNDNGIGFYLNENELAFLNEYSNWIHFSLLPESEELFARSIAGYRVLNDTELGLAQV